MLQYFANLFNSNKDEFYNILLTFLIIKKVNDTVPY